MLKELHEMGFSVMLWICPFITPDTLEFREARDKHFLIETPEKTSYPGVVEWVFCSFGSDESGCDEVAEGSAGCSDGYGCGWL